jgi:hypothetical protein
MHYQDDDFSAGERIQQVLDHVFFAASIFQNLHK